MYESSDINDRNDCPILCRDTVLHIVLVVCRSVAVPVYLLPDRAFHPVYVIRMDEGTEIVPDMFDEIIEAAAAHHHDQISVCKEYLP